MGLGIGRGLVGLFKSWGKGIGNAADHVLLGEEARKAIKDEVTNKFKPKIDLAHRAESRRAANIKDLGEKVSQSKQELADAKQAWQEKYDNALADAQTKRQTDIADYNTQLQGYQKALADANAGRKSIFDKLYDSEDNYDSSKTIFTDVNTGDSYLFTPATGQYTNLTKIYPTLTREQKRKVNNVVRDFDNRLYDSKSGKVINAFDDDSNNTYAGKNKWFDEYYHNKISTHNADIRDAEKQIQQAQGDLTNWQGNNSLPKNWNKRDSNKFDTDFRKNNVEPTEYSFNGKNYSKESDLEGAYKDALTREQNRQDLYGRTASEYASRRDAEIAKRIQDAKDINKAKILLGSTLGAGALYAGARAMYGGDDTDNTDNINNIDNTDYGNPDPEFKAENTPEGKAAIIGKPFFDTADFDPDKADAIATLAAASHDAGVEDSNSIESSDDRIIDDAELYKLLKAMEDPHKADAVANYIYSKHGNESDVQNLGWRGWLNKYYGDLLRSRMNLDPSSYKGMHISGGL